jgi:hypothetical protein
MVRAGNVRHYGIPSIYQHPRGIFLSSAPPYADPSFSANNANLHPFPAISHGNATLNLPHFPPSVVASPQYLLHPASLVLGGNHHLGSTSNLAAHHHPSAHQSFQHARLALMGNNHRHPSDMHGRYGPGVAANLMLAVPGHNLGLNHHHQSLFGESFAIQQLAATQNLICQSATAVPRQERAAAAAAAAMRRNDQTPAAVLSIDTSDVGPIEGGSFRGLVATTRVASVQDTDQGYHHAVGGGDRSRNQRMGGMDNDNLQNDRPMKRARAISKGRTVPLYLDSDEQNLSHYQCLARQQIELFETTDSEAGSSAQGRNRPIVPGQVGIRCKHCAHLPRKQRKTGSVYYPSRVRIVNRVAS